MKRALSRLMLLLALAAPFAFAHDAEAGKRIKEKDLTIIRPSENTHPAATLYQDRKVKKKRFFLFGGKKKKKEPAKLIQPTASPQSRIEPKAFEVETVADELPLLEGAAERAARRQHPLFRAEESPLAREAGMAEDYEGEAASRASEGQSGLEEGEGDSSEE